MPSTSIRTGAFPLYNCQLLRSRVQLVTTVAYLICSALVPSTRAFSYFVI